MFERIKGVAPSTCALALITVCLRFTARRLDKAGLWYDDWFMLPALLFTTVLCATSIWMAHEIESELSQQRFHTSEIISEIFWGLVMWMVKTSILAFYWRLFSVNNRKIRVIILILAVSVTCWGIAVFLLTTLQCTPISDYWTIGYGCHYLMFPLLLGSTIPHIITDLLLLSFPAPIIWKLDILRAQKYILIAIFAMGSFVTVVSIVRMVYLIENGWDPNGSFDEFEDVFIWTNVETNMSIICACLPCLRPILALISKKLLPPIRSLISKKLELLHKRRKGKSNHKRGPDLLMDILRPRGSTSPELPFSKAQSLSDGNHSLLDPSAPIRAGAKDPRALELDAEAPGPHILEIETLEPALEMESGNQLAEMEGWSRPEAELEGRSNYNAELQFDRSSKPSFYER